MCVSPSFLLTVSNENLSGIDVILGGDWWIVIGGILIGLLPWLTPSFIPAFFFLFSSIFPPFFLSPSPLPFLREDCRGILCAHCVATLSKVTLLATTSFTY